MVKDDEGVSDVKFKNVDFDFLLKRKVVDWFDLGINMLVRNDLRGAFQCFKSLASLIGYYDFSSKALLSELMDVLSDYFESLGSSVSPKRKDVVVLRDKQRKSLIQLMDVFFSELAKSYAELGLWFNTRSESKDFDLLLSEENFNDSFSGLKDKKAFLSGLGVSELLDCLPVNHLHDLYARVSVERVLKGRGGV